MPYNSRTAPTETKIAKDKAAQRAWADAASEAMNASGGDLGFAVKAANATKHRPKPKD